MIAQSNSLDSRQAPSMDNTPPNRRAALAKLGLATIVAYGAPSIVHLARAAQAGPSKNCGKPGKPPCA